MIRSFKQLSRFCALGAVFLGSLCQASTLTSLSFLANGGCVTTVVDGCAPIGLTATGSTAKPFLNDLDTKEINLATGTYYTFNEPFFTTGDSLEVIATFSNGVTIDVTDVVPDVNTAGHTVLHANSGGEDVVLKTTGQIADRMSFGFAPDSFNPSGTDDTIFQLTFSEPRVGAVPEPATIGLLGLAGITISLIRRRRNAS